MTGPSRRVAGRRRRGDDVEGTPTVDDSPIVPARRRPMPPRAGVTSDDAVGDVVSDVVSDEPTVDEIVEAADEPVVGDAVEMDDPEAPEPEASEPEASEPEASSPEPSEPEAAEPETATARATSGLSAPIVAAAVALLLVVASVFWLIYLNDRAPIGSHARQPAISDAGIYTPGTIESTAGAQAVQAAVTALPVVLSYDYRSLASGIAKAKTYLTPSYTKLFEQTYATTVSKFAAANKTVTRALVRSAGLVSVTKNSAVVLVFLDEALVPGDGSQPKVNLDRVKLTLVRSHGKWLIDSLTPF